MKPKKQLVGEVDEVDEVENVIEALDDVPIADEDAKAVIAKLGIDDAELKSLAASMRSKVSTRISKAKIQDAREAYAKEIERLESRTRKSARRSREEEVAHFEVLLAKAKSRAPAGVALHFLKYESASDEELSELIRSLEHLLGDE
jgi:hypothetical protein